MWEERVKTDAKIAQARPKEMQSEDDVFLLNFLGMPRFDSKIETKKRPANVSAETTEAGANEAESAQKKIKG